VPVFEKALVIETGIDQNIAAIAAQPPDHHRDIKLARRIRPATSPSTG
jgi:hypothetical protein